MEMTPEQRRILREQTLRYAECCKATARLKRELHLRQKRERVQEEKENLEERHSSGKKRWTPTPIQLRRMEQLFFQGEIITTKDRVRELLVELQPHGPITALNIANWFQNKKSRTRRRLKQSYEDIEVNK